MNNQNLTKQFLKWAGGYGSSRLSALEKSQPASSYAKNIKMIEGADRFILPNGGRLTNTYEIKTFSAGELDKPIRLPYPVVALEYLMEKDDSTPENSVSLRRIALAAEMVSNSGDIYISVAPIFQYEATKIWAALKPVVIAASNPLINKNKAQMIANFPLGDFSIMDWQDETWAVLSLIDALNCNNVITEKKRQGAKNKPANPINSYHVVKIKTSRTSDQPKARSTIRDRHQPREHLRRGHVRRLASGGFTWVNAAIVNAGTGGKIEKHYEAA